MEDIQYHQNDEESVKFFNSSRAYYWSEAVIYQGKITIEAAKENIKLFSHNFENDIINYTEYAVYRTKKLMEQQLREQLKSYNLNDEEFQYIFDDYMKSIPKATLPRDHEFKLHFLNSMQEYFFVVALGGSVDYLKKPDEFIPICKEILDSLGGWQAVKDLRNMREHDDEYVSGLSSHEEARKRFCSRNEELSIKGDATGTSVDFVNKRYMLGTNINLFKVVETHERYIGDIQKIYYELLDSMMW